MDFGLSEEQELLKAEVRKFLDARCPLEQVRKLMETGPGYSRRALAGAGRAGLARPDRPRGAGRRGARLGRPGGAAATRPAARCSRPRSSRPRWPPPRSATAGTDAQKARWLPSLADGTRDRDRSRCSRRATCSAPTGVALAGQAGRRRVRADRREDVRARRGRRESVRRRVPHRPARKTWRSAWSSAARRA